MGKPTICIGENNDADQLRGNREADQRLCFRYTDITFPLLSKYKISSLYQSSVTLQPGLCRTWSEPELLVFSRTGTNESLSGLRIYVVLGNHDFFHVIHVTGGIYMYTQIDKDKNNTENIIG